MTERKSLIPQMSTKTRQRSTLAAIVLAALGALSQVPWTEVLAFASRVLGTE